MEPTWLPIFVKFRYQLPKGHFLFGGIIPDGFWWFWMYIVSKMGHQRKPKSVPKLDLKGNASGKRFLWYYDGFWLPEWNPKSIKKASLKNWTPKRKNAFWLSLPNKASSLDQFIKFTITPLFVFALKWKDLFFIARFYIYDMLLLFLLSRH